MIDLHEQFNFFGSVVMVSLSVEALSQPLMHNLMEYSKPKKYWIYYW